MVEWEEEEEEEEDSNDDKDGDKDDDNEEKKKRNPRADWHVSWEGKTTALLSARDGAEGEDRLHRIYFLLAPGTSVPPVVKLSRGSASTSPDTHNNTGNPNPNPNPPAPCTTTATTTTTTIEIKPLPAIFPPELGLRGTAAGRRGILHTRYAKQRLAVLRLEIEREMRTNGEGIGLEIAVQEKQWLEDNFGVGEYQKRDQDGDISNNNNPASSPSLKTTTPGGRLAERLRGLKLGTSREVLAGSASGGMFRNFLSFDSYLFHIYIPNSPIHILYTIPLGAYLLN